MTLFFYLLFSVVFWGCLILIGHTYALYPLLLGFLARGKSLPSERFEQDDEFPEVAVLMAVYNEEAVLEATLASILASDYPVGKMKVYIGSDGSTDRSDAIGHRFRETHPQLHLTVFGGRNGKIRIINQLAADATASFADPDSALYVLCDANVVWTPSLVRRLASHFKRPAVGLVGAAVKDKVREHAGIGDEEEAYIGQENLVKYREGVLWGNVVGAFGACYALRAPLFSPVPVHHIVDDFFLTFQCLEKGGAAIVDLDAVCYEAVSTEISEEFRRKRRIATGNFQNFRRFWNFIQPWNSNFATFFAFWSHKGLRWCGPFLIIGMILSAAILAFMSPFYLLPVLGLSGTFLAAGLDQVTSSRERGRHVTLFRFIRYFYTMNVALFLGFVAFAKGVGNSVWEPTKREAPGTSTGHAGPARPAKAPAAARR
jgi:cellulose synthase/poly-beta-1,6-N-acetylglucosamine synthase-like glycosyltransferase